MNYLETITRRKLEDNRTKIEKDYTNRSLGFISGMAVLAIKSTNSSAKVKALKNSFLTNCQTIYLTLPEISYNNSLLF